MRGTQQRRSRCGDRCGTTLLKYGSIADPNELHAMAGISNNTAVLVVLRDSFKNARWDLLHEAANLLQNCIVLNAGGTVA